MLSSKINILNNPKHENIKELETHKISNSHIQLSENKYGPENSI